VELSTLHAKRYLEVGMTKELFENVESQKMW